MGQLIAKLMGIFGKQGKRRRGHSSDCFTPALTWSSPIWGCRGGYAGGPRTRRVLRGRSSPAPHPPLLPPLFGRAPRLRCSPGRKAGRASFLLAKSCRRFPAIVTSRSALSPDPFSWQAQSAPDLMNYHFSGNVERGKWGSALTATIREWRKCPGPMGKKSVLLVLDGGGGRGRRSGQESRGLPGGDTCLLPGRPGGAHSPLVIGFGPDPALPSDAFRAQGYHRGTGQRRKDHHSLPVVSDSGGERRGLGLPTRLIGIWTNHLNASLGTRVQL